MGDLYKVWAVFRPHLLDDVAWSLVKMGIGEFTASEARGLGNQKGHTGLYRGSEYEVDFLPKIKLEVIVEGDLWRDKTVATIARTAKTGNIGDGKIFVEPVDSGINIIDGTSYKPTYP